MKKRLFFRNKGIISYLFLVGIFIVVVFPNLFMLANSFMGENEIMKHYGILLSGNSDAHVNLYFIPEEVTLAGYFEVFLFSPRYLMKFWNSLFLSGSIVIGQTLVAICAGYGLAKFRFKGKNIVMFFIIILTMMPQQVTLVPGFLVLDKMGLIGSYTAVILPGVFTTFGTFLLSQVFSGVPDSLLEAAKIDGANHWQLFQKIAVPYAKTGIAALVILCFIDNWNMIEQALIYLRDSNKYPLSIFLSFINTNVLGVSFVCGILTMIPVTILFLFLKDALIRGIEYTNLK